MTSSNPIINLANAIKGLISKHEEDKNHAEAGGTPKPIGKNLAAGTNNDYARADHVHTVEFDDVLNTPNALDVVDNLTTNDGSKPLSAKQGKWLNDNKAQLSHNHDTSYISNSTGSVTSNHIADGTIVNGDIADGTITGPKLAEKTITAGRIGDGAITTTNIGDGKVTTSKIADSNITTAKIADSAVTSAKIANETIVNADISTNAQIAGSKIADGTITSAKIADGTIVNADIASNAAIAYSKLSGVAPSTHTHTDSQINFNGSGYMSPIDAALNHETSTNKIAFLPPNNLTVQYANSSTSTLTTYSVSDANKTKIMSASSIGGVPLVGGGGVGTISTSDKLVVTVDAGNITNSTASNIYTSLKKIHLYFSVGSCTGCQVKVETADYPTPTTWVDRGTYALSGGSYWNVLPLNITFGGYAKQNVAGHVRYIKLTFTCTGTGNNSSRFALRNIQMFGITNWTIPSNLASIGHIYNYNENQDAIFPAKIIKSGGTSSQFLKADGSVDSNAYSTTSHTHNYLPTNANGTTTGTVTAAGFKVGTQTGFLKANGTVDTNTYNNYSHPTNYGAKTGVPTGNATLTHGGTFTVTQPVTDTMGHVTALNTRTYTLPTDNNTTYSVATQSTNGLLSSTDKKKLDGITESADSVSFTQTKTSGIEIGKININGTSTTLYQQDNNTTYTAESTATNIKMNGTQAVGSLSTYARGDHVHPTDTSRAPKQDSWCGSIDTTHWYLKPISFEIKGGYTDRPITFRLDSRRPNPIYVTIIFRNENSTDPQLATFETTGGDNACYLYKEATSKWSLIVKKSELYDGLITNQLVNNNTNITITYPNQSLQTLPTSNIQEARRIIQDVHSNLLDGTRTFTGSNYSNEGITSSLASYTHNGCTVRYFNGGQSQNVGFRWTIPTTQQELSGIYTLSFWARTDSNHSNAIAYFYQGVNAKRLKSNGTLSNSGEGSFGDGGTAFNLTNAWRRYYVTWQINSSGTLANKTLLIRLTTTSTSASQNLIVCGVKFEKGPHATEYCESVVDGITDATITRNKIVSKTITGNQIADSTITTDKITNGTIVNADISASAGIDASKIIDSQSSGYTGLNITTNNASQSAINSRINMRMGYLFEWEDQSSNKLTASNLTINAKVNKGLKLVYVTISGTSNIAANTEVDTAFGSSFLYLYKPLNAVRTILHPTGNATITLDPVNNKVKISNKTSSANIAMSGALFYMY